MTVKGFSEEKMYGFQDLFVKFINFRLFFE